MSISKTGLLTFIAMLTARLAATNDLPSPGMGLVTIRDRGGFPDTGYRRLDRSILNCSASNDWGLKRETRF